MSNTTISVLVRCWYDPQTNALQLQVMRTDTSEAVPLGNNSFLLHFSVDKEKVARCQIRHIESGREAYVQGGPRLVAFVNDCLLNGSTSEYDDQGATEK
jgi:hypothetical protein